MRWGRAGSEGGRRYVSLIGCAGWAIGKRYEMKVLEYHSDPTFTADGDELKL